MVTPADYAVLSLGDGWRLLVGTTQEANALPRSLCPAHRFDFPTYFGCPGCEKEAFGDNHYLPDAQEINAVLVAESHRQEVPQWRQRVRQWAFCVLLCAGIGLVSIGAVLVELGLLP